MPGAAPDKQRTARVLGLVAIVVIGLIVGLVGVRFLYDRARSDGGGSAAQGVPGSSARPPRSPSTSTDPSRSALSSLIVKPEDVATSLPVVLLLGGDGLSQPTLDLCNGTFPSESRRTARLQDVVLDEKAEAVLSTEAVLYRDAAAAEKAMSELDSVVASCPSTPVASPVGEPAATTTFNPRPDGDWPQTPSVNRKAFDFNSVDESGQTSHYVAVYLQRGRALMGVYFPKPEAPPAVAGQTTISGIVGVFAERMAALPASVVGS
ncbi:MAG: hypothetical protein QOJ69_1206 [Actinomycetota bacterium]|jgi:hypothetical protein|nr:hypothetical protein [Actinomycetota bacterium]